MNTIDTEPVPLLRVVRGNPTTEELAALAVVLAARAAAAESPSSASTPAPSLWADHSRGVRRTLPHGPGAWRASALP